MTKPNGWTGEQMRVMADELAHDLGGEGRYSKALRQAANDLEVKERFAGFYKVVEECGELLTVMGKLGPFPSGDHPDGAGHLYPRIQDELADVRAATKYFARHGGFNVAAIDAREANKVNRFEGWGLTGLRGDDQIDVKARAALSAAKGERDGCE